MRGTEKWRRRDTYCLSVLVTLDRSSYQEAFSTLHFALENGSDLHVNERQKIRHYRARSTEERRRIIIE